jgi:hypothetical protein
MRKVLGRRPSPATVISLVALFVALGGTSYAAIVITGGNVRNGSLTGADIRTNSVTGRDITRLRGVDVRNNALSGADIQGIRGVDVNDNSLGGGDIDESSLGKVPSATNSDQLGGQPASAFGKAERWALIQGTAAGATILAQSGGMSAARIAAGVYNVDVNASVVRLPLTGTLNTGAGLGEINLAPCGGNANNPGGINCPGVNDTTHVIVVTGNSAGAATDRTFYVRIGG